MHELSITQSLVDLVLEHAARAGSCRVTGVHLRLGALSSVAGDSVQFYWDILAQGTPAAGSQLHFLRVSATFQCKDCGHEFQPAGEEFVCPGCASAHVHVVAGDDLQLEAIDVEEAHT